MLTSTEVIIETAVGLNESTKDIYNETFHF